MSAPNEPFALAVEDDGTVMIAASGVVAYLRHCAEAYGSGDCGGSEPLRRGARDALTGCADQLESQCIAVGADALTDGRWRS